MHLCCKRWHRSLLKAIVVVITPLVILPLPLVAGTKEAWCGYVLLLTATYWITEAMPLGVTALLPAALFPVTGILPSKQIAPFYMTETVMLFLGCFTMAAAIVKCNLHKRFALKIMLTIGCTPPRLLLGFMLAALLLSMWMSNTTATAMMMPIAEAVLAQLRLQEEECAKPELEVLDVNGKSENLQLKAESGQLGSLRTKSPKVASTNNRVFGKALCLAVAYAASCGGTATLIGCGPTILMKAFVDRYYETLGVESAITFANWMLFGFPLGIIMMLFAWIWLQLLWFGPRVTVRAMNIFSKKSTNDDEAQTVEYVLKREYGKLGPIRFSEISTLLIFIIAIGLWITRNPGFMPGWKYLFSEGSVGSMVPAIFGVILLFVWPIRAPWSKQDKVYIYEPLMDLKTLLSGVPWDIVLLYGGGMAVAEGCKVSGLSIWMGNQLSGLEGLQPWLLTLILCFVLSLFTEFTSNAATVAIVLPVLEEMAHVMSINPLVLVIPGAMGCSFAFMLPVATPPNAIVYSYGYLRISEMIKSGAVMNVICIVIFMMAMFAWGDAIFKFDSMPLESTLPTATFDDIVATTVQPVI